MLPVGTVLNKTFGLRLMLGDERFQQSIPYSTNFRAAFLQLKGSADNDNGVFENTQS